MSPFMERLFLLIAHGDEKHRGWLYSAMQAHEQSHPRGGFVVPQCAECRQRPATCLGCYADHDAETCPHEGCTQHGDAYSCDECCGHGCEDGSCRPLEQSDYRPYVDMMSDVEAFHVKFGLFYEGKPRVLPLELAEFRRKFLEEEVEEYTDWSFVGAQALAMKKGDRDAAVTESLSHMLDALVDEIYVALGTAQLQGLDIRAAWARVHEANMAKERAQRATDSKRGTQYDVVKPPGWVAPDHTDLVADHAHRKG